MSIFDFFSGNPARTGMAMLLCGALAGGGAAVAVPAAIDTAADRVMDKVDARIGKALAAYYKGQSWYRDQGLDITADSLTGAARKSFVALKKLAKEECPDLYRKLCR